MEWVQVESLLQQIEDIRVALIEAKAPTEHETALLNDAYFYLVSAQKKLKLIISCEQ